MITFSIGLSGKQITLKNFDKYIYFYHINARFVDNLQYVYCNFVYNNIQINDIEKIIDYKNKLMLLKLIYIIIN